MSDTTTATTPAAGELRTLALSAITVRSGFNPRSAFDEPAIARLADTIRSDGVLQPLLVQPAATDGEYELVDGERRYRAALQAGLTEVPVLVRACESTTSGLIGALTANFHRAAHTPVEEAHAFQRLLDAGLTRKGVSERLRVSRELVRDRLEILELPPELHARVDDGTIPLGALRTLGGLAKIHPGLPACALRRVTTEPTDSWRRRVSWSDVVADPIGAVTAQYGDDVPDLPDGVYEAFADYPLSAFTLGERAQKDLAALARLNSAYGDRDQVSVRFDRDAIEHAAKLGSAHTSEHGHSALIVSADIAEQLVADQLKKQLRDERARARRESEHTAATTPAGSEPASDAAQAPVPETEEQANARRAAERAAEQQRRAAAVAFNLELGVAVVKAFAKTKVDARVLRILTAVDFKDDLDALAARGARYGFPGWPSEQTTKGGKPKTVYLERHQANARAHEFLAGATHAQEIAGRCLALVVMAVLADEACVAQSNRSMVSLSDYRPSYQVPGGRDHGLPWRRDVIALIEELALERLPEHLTQHIRQQREPQHARETTEREPQPDAVTHSAPTDTAAPDPDGSAATAETDEPAASAA